MATIHLQCDYKNAFTSVPNTFIEQYMAVANGEFVKVYLYLLHELSNQGSGVSISVIADSLNHTENDVMRALNYWEKNGVLRIDYDENKQFVGLSLCDLWTSSASSTAPQATAPVVEAAPTKKKGAKAPKSQTEACSFKKREYSLDEVNAFCNNHEISELLFIIETYLRHPLNSTEMNTIFFWYDTLHFSGELIEYLVEYCITNGHSSLRYMDKVALGWAENGIDTIDKAKEHVSIRSKAYYSIMKAFGISGRNLAESEMTYVNRWSKEYNFDIELIQEACRRTIAKTQRPSFEYADSILTSWHNSNVHTLKDVEALDETFKAKKPAATSAAPATSGRPNKFNNFTQREYDYDQLERMLLTTTVQ